MGNLVRMFSAAIVWGMHFMVLYAFTAFACARDVKQALPYVLGSATLAALGVLAVIIARAYPQRAQFVAGMTIAMGALAVVAIVFSSLAFTMVPACR